MVRDACLPNSILFAYPSTLFFFNNTAATEIYTLSLHDALPISQCTVCGFQYALSEPPYRGPFQPGADQTENPFVRSFKIMAVALLVLAGVGALLLGILFVGCALAVRG